jgi:pimeloyl-ACP methyl ester carboxylesterase
MAYVSIGDIKLFYEVFLFGEKQEKVNPSMPTLIVLHGGTGTVDHSLYTPFWSCFSLFMQVIFPDQRGNGLSDHGDPEKWNLDVCGNDVYLFCEALHIKKPIVAGISWGGYVAMSYVTQYPEHPSALIFCNTEAKVSAQARKKMFTQLGGHDAGEASWESDHYPSKEGVRENFIKKCLPHYARRNPYTAELLSKFKKNIPMQIKFVSEEFLTFDFRSKLSCVCCPTLLIAGDHDAGHPLECALETFHSIPKKYATLEVIQDAGAPVYNDQPALVYAQILKFMASTSGAISYQMPKMRFEKNPEAI